MKKIIFLFTAVSLMAFSCSKSDDEEVVTPLRDYATQRDADKIIIETYLKKHKLNPDITDYSANINNSNLFVTCTEDDAASLAKLTTTSFPKLLTKEVEDDGIIYMVYYLVFNEGNATEKPCPFDEVLVTYRGTSLASGAGETVSATEFDSSLIATKLLLTSTNYGEYGTISGWQEIFPMFGKGIFDEVATGNGPNVYTNYGVGVMFLPSGLGYYQQSSTNIPEYSSLVFSFQLMNFIRKDNDNDGILTVDEITRNANGSFTKTDTDGDGTADYKDFDDDNDGYPTRNEIKKPTPLGINQGTSLYYPFNPIIDNPLTTDIDESEPKGIPDKSGDGVSTTRIRRHLDNTAKPPYTTY